MSTARLGTVAGRVSGGNRWESGWIWEAVGEQAGAVVRNWANKRCQPLGVVGVDWIWEAVGAGGGRARQPLESGWMW